MMILTSAIIQRTTVAFVTFAFVPTTPKVSLKSEISEVVIQSLVLIKKPIIPLQIHHDHFGLWGSINLSYCSCKTFGLSQCQQAVITKLV